MTSTHLSKTSPIMKYPKLLVRDDGEIFKNNGDDTYSMVSTEMCHPYRWPYKVLERTGFFKEHSPKNQKQKIFRSWRECAIELAITADYYFSSGDDRKLKYTLKGFERFNAEKIIEDEKI